MTDDQPSVRATLRTRLAADIAAGKTVSLSPTELADPELRAQLPALLDQLTGHGPAPAGVRVPGFTLLTENGTTRTVQDTVTANGRYSMDVAGTFPEARGTRFSVLVESVSGAAPLVVERASYSSTPSTPWSAGTNSLGTPLP